MPDLSSSWRFGDVDVHPDLNTVVRDGVETPVPPRVMEVLVHLIEHRETVVTTEELLQTYWPGRIVEESTLHRLVSQMRQALGDSARSPKYIRTVSKRGYQAIAQAEVLSRTVPETQDDPESPEPDAEAPPTAPEGLQAAPPSEPVTPVWRWLVPAVVATLVAVVGAAWVLNERVSGAPAPPLPEPVESIAVLPFVLLSEDSGAAPVAKALADGILDELAAVGHMKVASRTTTWLLAEKGHDLSSIASQVGVDYVLEGSLQEVDGTLRVTAQLIRASDGYHVFSRAYDTRLVDGLVAQDALARNIGQRTHDKIWDDMRRQDPARFREFAGADPRAIKLYLDSQSIYSEWVLSGEGDLGLAMQLVQKAVDVDPTFRLALSDLAWNHLRRIDPTQTIAQASAGAHGAIDRIFELNPGDLTAYFMLMQVFVQLDLNYERAEKLYEAAVELAPRAMWWRGMMAGVHLREGRVDEALRLNELEVANGIENIKGEFLPHHVLVLRAGGRYESSLEVTEDALELIHGGRQRAGLLANKANVLLDLGRIDEARVALSEGWQIGRYDAPEIFAVAFARIGEPDRARAALAAASLGPTNHGDFALAYQELGELDAAFEMLFAGIEEHDRSVLDKMRLGYWSEDVLADPRFDELMRLLESKETPTAAFREARVVAPERNRL